MRRVLLPAALLAALAWPAAAQEVGDPAPDVEFGETINGTGEKSLREFRGKVVFLEIWATW